MVNHRVNHGGSSRSNRSTFSSLLFNSHRWYYYLLLILLRRQLRPLLGNSKSFDGRSLCGDWMQELSWWNYTHKISEAVWIADLVNWHSYMGCIHWYEYSHAQNYRYSSRFYSAPSVTTVNIIWSSTIDQLPSIIAILRSAKHLCPFMWEAAFMMWWSMCRKQRQCWRMVWLVSIATSLSLEWL